MNQIRHWRFVDELPSDKDVIEKFSVNPPNVYGFGHQAYYQHVIECLTNQRGALVDGLEGRKSGTIPGFNYSEANKAAAIVWNEAQFLDYIKDPKAKIPNTKMVFAGIKNEAEAKALWAYLSQFDAEGKKK